MEERYKKNMAQQMMADWCWNLKRIKSSKHSRRSNNQKFLPWQPIALNIKILITYCVIFFCFLQVLVYFTLRWNLISKWTFLLSYHFLWPHPFMSSLKYSGAGKLKLKVGNLILLIFCTDSLFLVLSNVLLFRSCLEIVFEETVSTHFINLHNIYGYICGYFIRRVEISPVSC